MGIVYFTPGRYVNFRGAGTMRPRRAGALTRFMDRALPNLGNKLGPAMLDTARPKDIISPVVAGWDGLYIGEIDNSQSGEVRIKPDGLRWQPFTFFLAHRLRRHGVTAFAFTHDTSRAELQAFCVSISLDLNEGRPVEHQNGMRWFSFNGRLSTDDLNANETKKSFLQIAGMIYGAAADLGAFLGLHMMETAFSYWEAAAYIAAATWGWLLGDRVFILQNSTAAKYGFSMNDGIRADVVSIMNKLVVKNG